MAVTATATPETRQDIMAVLALRRPVRVVQSFDRPNLVFEVESMRSEEQRLHRLKHLLREVAGTSIVYTPTRDRTDGTATLLREAGFSALPYHAGLPGAARRALLGRFLESRCRVMVATSAFGMGIDKPDVRLVVHLGVPARPEAYFQEAGRAGRDGERSRCVMLWTKGDLDLSRRMALGGGGDCPPGRPSRDHRDAARRGFRAMRRYVRTRRCRRRVLLEYLGEHPAGCTGCDHCG
jgi:ATP-dependent DNA helicase RecQ